MLSLSDRISNVQPASVSPSISAEWTFTVTSPYRASNVSGDMTMESRGDHGISMVVSPFTVYPVPGDATLAKTIPSIVAAFGL